MCIRRKFHPYSDFDQRRHDSILKADQEAVIDFYHQYGPSYEIPLEEEIDGVVAIGVDNGDDYPFSEIEEVEILLKTPRFQRRFLRYWELPDKYEDPKAIRFRDKLFADVKKTYQDRKKQEKKAPGEDHEK